MDNKISLSSGAGRVCLDRQGTRDQEKGNALGDRPVRGEPDQRRRCSSG